MYLKRTRMHTKSEPKTEHSGALVKQDTAEKVVQIQIKAREYISYCSFTLRFEFRVSELQYDRVPSVRTQP